MMTKNLFTKCFVMMALAVLFVGCPKPTDSPEVVDDNVTLTFLYNDAGSEDYELTMKVKKGVKKALPLISDEFFSSWQAPGGKMFGGWVVSKGDVVTDEERSADPTIFDVGKLDSYTKNTTFVARWGTPVTVTFDKKNGTVDFGEQQMVTEFPMPLKDIYKTATEIGAPTGKEFAGWANQNGKQVIARNAQLFKPDADCTLDAIWMGFNSVEKDVTVEMGNSTWGRERYKVSDDTIGFNVKLVYKIDMSDHEVTQKEWKDVMEIDQKELCNANNTYLWYDKDIDGDDEHKYDYYPIAGVLWEQAVAYCNKRTLKETKDPNQMCYSLEGVDWENWSYSKFTSGSLKGVTCDFSKPGYRLPTEAEWVYCAYDMDWIETGADQVSPKITKFALSIPNDSVLNSITFASSNGKIDQEQSENVMNYFNNYIVRYTEHTGQSNADAKELMKPVMSKNPNTKGFYDMSGSVWEWIWGDFKKISEFVLPSSTFPINDFGITLDAPTTSKTYLRKGGAWNSGLDSCKINNREENITSNQDINKPVQGFRVCRTVTP